MSKEAYRKMRFNRSTLALIDVCNGIATEYQSQGYVLTVRQMYYQLVARDVVVNNLKSYKRVASIINDARIAGLMDWDAIEDRTRAFISRQRWESPQAILDAAAHSYHVDMWEDQEARPFVVIEKEALTGILESTCRSLDTPLLAARGYPSASVLRDFAKRDLLRNCDQALVIIHLGDHDPSGMDMTRDLDDRLAMFTQRGFINLTIKRIALNMDQIEDQKPPPNPAKQTDARFEEYARKFGDESWELDALSPSYLNDLVETQIRDLIDPDRWERKEQEVKAVREEILRLGKDFRADA